MNRPPLPAILAAAVTSALLAGSVSAQTWQLVEDPEACGESRWNADWCEVREITLPSPDLLTVDGARSGGIRVTGEDRKDVLVRAKILIWDVDEDQGRAFADRIEISTDERIVARGPSRGEGVNWAVSYELLVPRESDLDLEAHNGGVSIEGVEGDIEFATRNGGVHLGGLAGRVRGETRNGGVSVELTGKTWRGAGLDVETRNGGVHLVLPDDYSADLETGTVNGTVISDIPGLDENRRSRRISTTVGDGGPTVRVLTTNGGVRIRQT